MNLKLLCLVFAGAVIIISVIMLLHIPQSAVLDDGFSSPIIAFEFARDAKDVEFLSGSEYTAVAARQGMVNGLALDMMFPFAYAGYLLLLLLQLEPSRLIKGLGIFTFCSIVLLDIHENLHMLRIIDVAGISAFKPQMFIDLYLATWLKWAAIVVALALLALRYAARKQWLMLFCALPYCGLAIVACLLDSPAYLVEPMALCLSVFLLISFVDQVRQFVSALQQVKQTR